MYLHFGSRSPGWHPTFILALTGCSLINILPSSDSSEDGDNSSSALSSSENGSTSSSNGSISEEIPPIAYDENVVLESTAEYEQFWNPATSLHFNITMSQEAADFINTYQSNHDDSTYHDYYVPCTFTYIINGEEQSCRNLLHSGEKQDQLQALNRDCV